MFLIAYLIKILYRIVAASITIKHSTKAKVSYQIDAYPSHCIFSVRAVIDNINYFTHSNEQPFA
jgi:hypothetical protein